MKCPKCGARLEYGRICDNCGMIITHEMIQQMEQDRGAARPNNKRTNKPQASSRNNRPSQIESKPSWDAAKGPNKKPEVSWGDKQPQKKPVLLIVLIVLIGLFAVAALIYYLSQIYTSGKKYPGVSNIINNQSVSRNYNSQSAVTPRESRITENSRSNVESKSSAVPTSRSEESNFSAKLESLIQNKKAFRRGNYVKGDIPAGEYAFSIYENSGSFYNEDDASGKSIDYQDFNTFGYVKVHAAGNLVSRGLLVSMDGLRELGLSGAKELYEKLNNKDSWKESGHYKVGVDIEPGTYLLESPEDGFYSIKATPVGGGEEIIDFSMFDGRINVTVQEGQYLFVRKATLTKQ